MKGQDAQELIAENVVQIWDGNEGRESGVVKPERESWDIQSTSKVLERRGSGLVAEESGGKWDTAT